MAKVNMKETDYYKSGKQQADLHAAAVKALEVIQLKKDSRIAAYELCPNQCKTCNNNLLYINRRQKFCSRSCAAQFNNSERSPRTEESKLKTAISLEKYQASIEKNPAYSKIYQLICNECNLPFSGRAPKVKTCSKVCQSTMQGKWLSKHRAHILGNGKKSYMEQSFEDWLTLNYSGRWYDEIHFFNEESKKHGWADFVFPRKKLIIELDGSHHKKRKHLDDIRDEYLSRIRGYTVIRISHSEYKKQSKIEQINLLLNTGLDI